MTKAEGVSDWHENEVNHYTGKVAVNTRSYIYTNNPPANPYCEVKLYVTDSEGFEIYWLHKIAGRNGKEIVTK